MNTNDEEIKKHKITSKIETPSLFKIAGILRPAEAEKAKAVLKKLSKSEITALLQQAAENLQQETKIGLGEAGKKVSIRTVDDTKYIMRVIKPHFEIITKQKIQAIEDTYPETIKNLFDVAFCIIDGSFGEKLRDVYSSETPYSIPFKTILVLMLVYLSKSSITQNPTASLPEFFHQLKPNKSFEKTFNSLKAIDLNLVEAWVLDPNTLSENIDLTPISELLGFLNQLDIKADDEKVFMKLFQNFMDHLVNPSHLLIDLLIHKIHVIDRAIDTALMIRNPVDKSKAIELLILDFLAKNEIDRAIELWELIPTKQEKFKTSIKIAEKMIESGKIEEALKFSDEIKEQESHDHLLREASLRIAKHHLLNKALEVMENIKDSDIKHYTQSNLVHILCNQFDFLNAKKIALAIGEADFKEDAIVDIVKNYLTRRKYDEAIQFISSLNTPYEKRRPAKLIETALKIRHEDDKIGHVRDIFSLMKTPIRPAA
jgi:hypothetical protein